MYRWTAESALTRKLTWCLTRCPASDRLRPCPDRTLHRSDSCHAASIPSPGSCAGGSCRAVSGASRPRGGADRHVRRVRDAAQSPARLSEVRLERLVHPIGRFTIWVEHEQVPARVIDLFTNEAETFGVFPYGALGGETGTAGGLTTFHSDLFGRGKGFSASLIANRDNYRGAALYDDPGLGGGPWYLECRCRSAEDGGMRTPPSTASCVGRSRCSSWSRETRGSPSDAAPATARPRATNRMRSSSCACPTAFGSLSPTVPRPARSPA